MHAKEKQKYKKSFHCTITDGITGHGNNFSRLPSIIRNVKLSIIT